MWSCSTFKQEQRCVQLFGCFVSLKKKTVIQFFFHISHLTRSLEIVLIDIPRKRNCKNIIKMHQRATVYVMYIAERTSSSVRSLFSKGTGLWREGCVHVNICTVCICLWVCLSVCKHGGGDPYDTWIESLKPKQTVANSPAEQPGLYCR